MILRWGRLLEGTRRKRTCNEEVLAGLSHFRNLPSENKSFPLGKS